MNPHAAPVKSWSKVGMFVQRIFEVTLACLHPESIGFLSPWAEKLTNQQTKQAVKFGAVNQRKMIGDQRRLVEDDKLSLA